MKEQQYILENATSFEPKHIFDCGQCFRWDEEADASYTGIVKNNVINVKKVDNSVVFKSVGADNLEQLVIDYFDLNRNYEKIKNELSKVDEYLANSINYGNGIRILNQDLWETIISFIISANNNIKRIKLILNNIREALGESTNFGKKSFPSFERLKACDATFFKNVGAGYRADYLVKVLNQITPEKLEEYKSLPTNQLRAKLIELSGVGPKVADCILLFGYNRFDVFPVDTWIHQMYNKYFSPLENREIIAKKLVELFGDMSGYAQQYLFYFQRSIKE